MSRGYVYIPGKGLSDAPATDPLTGESVSVDKGSPSATGGKSQEGEFTGSGAMGPGAVSYTHLTLPTKRIV